jgi:hypothetical protein
MSNTIYEPYAQQRGTKRHRSPQEKGLKEDKPTVENKQGREFFKNLSPLVEGHKGVFTQTRFCFSRFFKIAIRKS